VGAARAHRARLWQQHSAGEEVMQLPSAHTRRLAVLLAHQRADRDVRTVASAGGAPFKIVFMEPGGVLSGGRVELAANHVKLAYPPEKVSVALADSEGEDAKRELADADACYGTLTPELLAAAPRLRWCQCPMAAPPEEYFFKELAESPVVVTNMRGIYDQELSVHIVTLMLAVNRQLGDYRDQQKQRKYSQLTFNRGEFRDAASLSPEDDRVDISTATALLVGVGNAGGETARLCKAFGMTTLGCDARRTEPHPDIDELYGAEALDELLPRADFVLVTVPHTPDTEGMFDESKFALMKSTGVFVNVGRGATTQLHDLDRALRQGTIGGAAVDVFEVEPLPEDHPICESAFRTPSTALPLSAQLVVCAC
jgi:phosphoglycerate dehydrogenase-like enzyme